MENKRLQLLFCDIENQNLHCHSIFSYQVDEEANLSLVDIIEMCRVQSSKVESKEGDSPLVLISVTDHNMLVAYEGNDNKNVNIKYEDGTIVNYRLTKKERRRLLDEERIRVIAGAELSASLNGIKVHTLALDFNPEILGLFKYTKERYRYSKKKVDVKKIANAVHLSRGYFVLAHPSRYVRDGKISLNDILNAANKVKCFDAIECVTSNMTLNECFEVLRFCVEKNIPVTLGTDYHYKGKRSVNGMPRQREDIFFIESLGMKTGAFLKMIKN